MKNLKRVFVMFLSFGFIINIMFTQTTYAASNSIYDICRQNITETINIDGINYTYDFYYENGNRVVKITNDMNKHIDKIIYDEELGIIYLNGVISARVSENKTQNARAMGEWETLSKDSKYITWGKGISTAALAASISVVLGFLGPAGVIAAMGTSALGVIAAGAIGGTVNVELQMYQLPLVAPQYRYIWSFKASTGDFYGPYLYHQT